MVNIHQELKTLFPDKHQKKFESYYIDVNVTKIEELGAEFDFVAAKFVQFL